MNDYIIIGSVATKFWFDDFRTPINDIDILYVGKVNPQMPSYLRNEFNALRIEYQTHSSAEYILSRKEHGLYMLPDELFTLKVSHAHWDIKHTKTLHDINFLKNKGCKLDGVMYQRLINTWEETHGSKKQVNLNQTVDKFFDDGVKRVYPHEYLHECVKFNDKPMHEYIRKNPNSVYCSDDLFFKLPLEQQMECALEEILVTAIERKHLTASMQPSTLRAAVIDAHKLLCTSMTKGWFARFLILNSHELLLERKEKCLIQLMNTLNLLALSKKY